MSEQPGTDPQGPSQEPAEDSQDVRSQQLEQELETERQKRLDAEKEAIKTRREARLHQSRADRMQRQINAIQNQRRHAPNSPLQQVEEERVEKAMSDLDTVKQEKMQELGLSDDDLPSDLEFASQRELELQLELAATNKKLDQSRASTEELESEEPSEEPAEQSPQQKQQAPPKPPSAEEIEQRGTQESSPPSGTLFDTGGPTGQETDPKLAKVDAMHRKAAELRAEGRRLDDPETQKSAAYLKLRALHNDPSKVMPVRESEADDLSDIDL